MSLKMIMTYKKTLRKLSAFFFCIQSQKTLTTFNYYVKIDL